MRRRWMAISVKGMRTSAAETSKMTVSVVLVRLNGNTLSKVDKSKPATAACRTSGRAHMSFGAHTNSLVRRISGDGGTVKT